MKLNVYLSKDSVVAIGAFFLFIATAAYHNISVPEYDNTAFGWEYGNIAEALVNGQGYSDPFGTGSGPTAWMPPLYVILLTGVFYVFGVKTIAAMWAVFVIKYIALAASLYFLLSIASKTLYRNYKYLLALLVIFLIYVNRGAYFRGLHDDWLILFLSCWMLMLFTTQLHGVSKANTSLLCILGFILPLSSPALAAAFLVVGAGTMLFGAPSVPSDKPRWLPYLAILACFATSTLLWTYRNYQIFGTVIPIKSNFGYDLYQANFLDADGLVTLATFENYHPINSNDMQAKYMAMGELRFTEEYRELSFTAIRSDPNRLLENISRRAMSTFLFMHPIEDIMPANPVFLSAEDFEKLAEKNLVSMNEPPFLLWTSLNLSAQEFESQIHPLRLTEEASVLQDWSARHNDFVQQATKPKFVLRSLLLSFIPALCILLALFHEKIRRNPVFIIAVTIYLTYLAPYIFASHYRRYQVPLIGLQSIFIFLVACALLEKFPFWKAPVTKLLPRKKQ